MKYSISFTIEGRLCYIYADSAMCAHLAAVELSKAGNVVQVYEGTKRTLYRNGSTTKEQP